MSHEAITDPVACVRHAAEHTRQAANSEHDPSARRQLRAEAAELDRIGDRMEIMARGAGSDKL